MRTTITSAILLWSFGCVLPVFGGAVMTDNLLLNPGAETGSLTNWTAGGGTNPRVDTGTFDPGINPHTGSFDFLAGSGAAGSLAQVIPLVGNQGLTAAAIDAGQLTADISFWEQGLNQGSSSDHAYIGLDFWDGASNVINTVSTPPIDSHNNAWSNYVAGFNLPAGTRYIQYTMHFVREVGYDLDAFVDDNSLIVLQSPAPPHLAIASSGAGTVTLQWPTNPPRFTLSQTANLQPAAWTDVTNVPTVVNTNYSVTVPVDAEDEFFRLHFP